MHVTGRSTLDYNAQTTLPRPIPFAFSSAAAWKPVQQEHYSPCQSLCRSRTLNPPTFRLRSPDLWIVPNRRRNLLDHGRWPKWSK